MSRAATAIAAAAAVAVLAAPSARAQSLADTMIAAYRTSGLLEQNRALLRAADEDVAQAVAALRPVLDWAASTTYSDPSPGGDDVTGSIGLSAQMLLFDFGNSQLAVDVAKETVLATRETLAGIEQQVLLRAVAAYFGVRRENAFVQLRQNNLRLIDQQLRAARDRFEVGEVTRTDVSIAEARLAAARSGLVAAQGALTRAIEEYRAVTGAVPTGLRPPPAAPATARSLDAARAVALERHPDIRRVQREVAAAELGLALAAGSVRPSLRASADYGLDQDGDDSASLRLSLSGPIYQGGRLSSVTRQARARRDAARAGLHTTRIQVEQDVANAWADLNVAAASLQASEEQVRAARLALRGAQEEFQVGARTTLDVLDREQELLDAETNRIAAEIDRRLAVYALLEAMGLLNVQHLGLGIATYDPAAYYNAVRNAPTGNVSPQGERLDRVLRSLGRE